MNATQTRSRRLLPVALALVASVLLAAGCGESQSSGPAPVLIGSLVPVTGLGLPGYLSAFNAAVRDVNAHGGIKGHTVKLENCDDQNDPNLAQACARQLARDNVIATVSDVSGFSQVEGPILDEMGIPQVGNSPLNPEDTSLTTSFPIAGSLLHQMAGGIVGMKRRGLQSLFVATSDSPLGHNTVQAVGPVVKSAGITLFPPVYVPVAASDLSMYVQAAQQSKAQVVFPALTPAQTIQFVMASRQAGAGYVIMVPYGHFTPADIAHMGGRNALTENDIEFSALPPLSAADQFPAIKQFTADMDAELAAGDPGAVANLRSGDSLSAWLSVQVIAKLAATLPIVNSQTIWGALLTSHNVDTLGLTPPWTPGHSGPAPFTRVTNLSGYLITQREGVEVLVDPTPFNPMQVLG